MKKKLLYFWGECKYSKVFIIFLIASLSLCIAIINISLQINNDNNTARFYKPSMAKNYIVEFGTAEEATIAKLKNLGVDCSQIATATVAGTVDGQNVMVVTPSVVNHMPKLDFAFSKKLASSYREIYIDKEVAKDFGYEKGKTYDMTLDYSQKIIKVKVIGFIDAETQYYCFKDFNNMITNYQEIIMCDNMPEDAPIQTAIFFNDIDPITLTLQNYRVKTCFDVYQIDSTAQAFIYLGIVIAILALASILLNYLINIDKMRKRFAIQHVCGIEYKTIFATEIFKMTGLFLISFIINVFLTLGLRDINYWSGKLMGFGSLVKASLIMLAIYVLALVVGTCKLVKIAPLESITTESED